MKKLSLITFNTDDYASAEIQEEIDLWLYNFVNRASNPVAIYKIKQSLSGKKCFISIWYWDEG